MMPAGSFSFHLMKEGAHMKYRKLYEVLDQRRNHNPNFRYTDYSGWNERPQTYLTLARPLWIIAEDHGTGYRFWITQSSRDMQVSYAKMTAKGNGPNLAYCRQCKKKSELAVIVSRLFAELDAAAAA